MHHDVAPDGSPVAVYLALPPGDTPALVQSVTPPGGSILELGSGPGRITRPLVDLGYSVVAVDNSDAMLAHIDFTEGTLADVYGLELDRTFDTVLAASHLVNDPDSTRRSALLDVSRRHVAPEGVVLIERYEPGWAANPVASTREIGPLTIEFEPLEVGRGVFRGRVVYTLGDRHWIQEFAGACVTDEMLFAEARNAGLDVIDWLNDSRTWAQLQIARR